MVRILNVYVGGFIVTFFVSTTVTVGMLCVICTFQPSKTQPYNVANIVSHVMMLIMLMTSVILKFPEPEDAWASPALVGLLLGGLQMPVLGRNNVPFSEFCCVSTVPIAWCFDVFRVADERCCDRSSGPT